MGKPRKPKAAREATARPTWAYYLVPLSLALVAVVVACGPYQYAERLLQQAPSTSAPRQVQLFDVHYERK